MVREWNFLLKSDLARCLEVGLPLLNGKAWERLSTTIFAPLLALKRGGILAFLKSLKCSQGLLRKGTKIDEKDAPIGDSRLFAVDR